MRRLAADDAGALADGVVEAGQLLGARSGSLAYIWRTPSHPLSSTYPLPIHYLTDTYPTPIRQGVKLRRMRENHASGCATRFRSLGLERDGGEIGPNRCAVKEECGT